MAGISRRNRWLAVGLAATMAVIGVEATSPSTIAAETTSKIVPYTCDGATGDNASGSTDSKTLLGALGALPPLDVSVSITAPATVEANSGDFDVSADIVINLPPSVTALAKDTLGLSQLTVTKSSLGITVSGPETTAFTANLPDRVVDLNGGAVQVSGSVGGKLGSSTSGQYRYGPGPIQFGVAINASVAGLNIGTVTIVCSSGGVIASTAVQIPGAPKVANVDNMIGYAFAGQLSALDLFDSGRIVPDNGNPIVKESLKIDGGPSGGLAAIWEGKVLFYSEQPGLYTVPVQVCAESMLVPMIPGKNEVQTLTWDKLSYAGNDFNAHPLGISLKYDGQETRIIPLSYWDPFGFGAQPTPVIGANPLDLFGSQFVPPSAATVQSALEALPNIGKNNISVAPAPKGYTITFKGARARKDVANIEVGQWFTWIDQETKAGVDALIKNLSGGAGSADGAGAAAGAEPAPPPPPTETWDSLNAKLLTGQISFDEWSAGAGKILQGAIIGSIPVPEALGLVGRIFPAKPSLAYPTPGEPDTPARMSGPLCTTFTATFAYFVEPR